MINLDTATDDEILAAYPAIRPRYGTSRKGERRVTSYSFAVDGMKVGSGNLRLLARRYVEATTRAPAPVRTILVTDERPEIVAMRKSEGRDLTKEVARFEKVPHDWTGADVRERFGIAEHLTVYERRTGESYSLLSAGRR